MKKDKLSDAVGMTGEKFLLEALERREGKRRSAKKLWIAGISLAAALALIVGAAFSPAMRLWGKRGEEGTGENGNESESESAPLPPETSVTLENPDFAVLASPGKTVSEAYPGRAADFNGTAGEAWRAEREAEEALEEATVPLVRDFYKKLLSSELMTGGKGEDRAVAPTNLYLALGMLAECAGGESREELLALLGCGEIAEARERASSLRRATARDDGMKLSLPAASLWLQKGGSYDGATLREIEKSYFASAYAGELTGDEMEKAYADWVRENTLGILGEDAGKSPFTPDTVMALAATALYQNEWGADFDPIGEAAFHTPEGESTAAFLTKTYDTWVYTGKGFTAAAAELCEGDLVWFFLPDGGTDPEELWASGEIVGLMTDPAVREKGEYAHLTLEFPEFTAASDLDLAESLKGLGVNKIFSSSESDFSSLTDREGLVLTAARHASRVKADARGIVAAALTGLSVGGEGATELREITLRLDRPFAFGIAGRCGALYFAGTVYDPAA